MQECCIMVKTDYRVFPLTITMKKREKENVVIPKFGAVFQRYNAGLQKRIRRKSFAVF